MWILAVRLILLEIGHWVVFYFKPMTACMRRGDKCEITMKFRLAGRIVDIAHQGQVVRTQNNNVAVQFESLDLETTQAFQQVISAR